MTFDIRSDITIWDGRTDQEKHFPSSEICLTLFQHEFGYLSELEAERLLHGKWSQAFEIQQGKSLFVMADKPRWRFLAQCPQPVSLEQFRWVCSLTTFEVTSLTDKTARSILEFLHGLCGVRLREQADWCRLPDSHFRLYFYRDGRNKMRVVIPQRPRRIIAANGLPERVRELLSTLELDYEIYQE